MSAIVALAQWLPGDKNMSKKVSWIVFPIGMSEEKTNRYSCICTKKDIARATEIVRKRLAAEGLTLGIMIKEYLKSEQKK